MRALNHNDYSPTIMHEERHFKNIVESYSHVLMHMIKKIICRLWNLKKWWSKINDLLPHIWTICHYYKEVDQIANSLINEDILHMSFSEKNFKLDFPLATWGALTAEKAKLLYIHKQKPTNCSSPANYTT